MKQLLKNIETSVAEPAVKTVYLKSIVRPRMKISGCFKRKYLDDTDIAMTGR